jgi:hypothetical protein
MIDPACGTGGFLIAMVLYIVAHFREMNRKQRDHLRHQALLHPAPLPGRTASRLRKSRPSPKAIREALELRQPDQLCWDLSDGGGPCAWGGF